VLWTGGAKGTAGSSQGVRWFGAGAYACLFTTIQRHDETDLDFLPMAAFCLCHGYHSSLGILPSNEEMTQHPFVGRMTLHYRTVYSGLLALGLLVMGTSARYLSNRIPMTMSMQRPGPGVPPRRKREGRVSSSVGRLGLDQYLLLFLPLRLEESVSAKPESRTMRDRGYQVLDFY
jgi:hypothetical protein